MVQARHTVLSFNKPNARQQIFPSSFLPEAKKPTIPCASVIFDLYNQSMSLGNVVGPNRVESVRAELEELAALLIETRAQLCRTPNSIDLHCRAAALDAEIERRRLLLSGLLST